jgi:hypothetical protein
LRFLILYCNNLTFSLFIKHYEIMSYKAIHLKESHVFTPSGFIFFMSLDNYARINFYLLYLKFVKFFLISDTDLMV